MLVTTLGYSIVEIAAIVWAFFYVIGSSCVGQTCVGRAKAQKDAIHVFFFLGAVLATLSNAQMW